MSTHSKKEKKVADKNSTTKSYTNKSEKLTGWDAIKNEPVGPYIRKMRKSAKASAGKRKADILKKEQAGYYKDKPLRDMPVGVGMRQIMNRAPKLDQMSVKDRVKKSRALQKTKQKATAIASQVKKNQKKKKKNYSGKAR
jgi:hypothetical protein